MSAAHDTGSSESSSGYEDGLGRRVLVFDRESGEVRERLRLRPELRVFVAPLQERLPLLAGLEDERFATPRAIETETDGRLAVVSDSVAGWRLSDIIDAAADQAIVAGLDAGLGLLLEILPALSRLHDAGLTHGAIAPGRIMITPAGQIVLVDAIYAEALERLQLTRRRLWAELRLAFPSTAGAPRFDKAADLTHAAMTAAALIVGRPLRDDEYPDGLAMLRREIVEIASIRASKAFADGVDAFFAAALPLPTRKTALSSADEAVIDLRKLLRKDVGITTCRTAMLEFFQQVGTADKERGPYSSVDQTRQDAPLQETERLDIAVLEAERAARDEAERKARDEAERKARDEAERKARDEAERKARDEAERKARDEAERKAREEAERKARDEAERKAREEAERKAREEAERKAREVAERKALEEAERKAREEAERKAREEAERKAREEAERKAREEAERKAREEAERKAREEAERKAREEAERKAREEAERKAREEAERKAREEAERRAREEAERKAREEAERKAREEAERKARAEAERKAREEAERKAREEAERKAREEAERKAREEAERKAREEAERREHERLEAERLEQDRLARERAEAEARDRERREREQREREREERERQAAAEIAAAVPPPAARSGWLVSPDAATSFEASSGEAEPVAQGAPAARAYPIYQPPAETESWTPEHEPLPTIEIAPVASSTPSTGFLKLQGGGAPAIKLKDEPGASPAGPARAESRQEPEQMSAADAYGPFLTQEESPPIPWKLIAAGVGLIAVTFGLTKGLLPSEIPVPTLGTLKKVEQAVKKAPPPAVSASSGAGGHLTVTTEPAGARILVDGKFVGSAPMTIDAITPGRHVVTLQGEGGAIKRTVRIEPGKTVSLDVPVFSGFAVISAPIVLDVAENGRALGTSDSQIMLGAGHHELHLENKDLDYTGTQAVDIEPGETAHVAVDPRGRANVNAIPWAEVYVDGQSIGQTPLANVAIRLGVRELVFKNPQFPDRKVVTTLKSGEPATITVDFTKDKLQ
jgi:membrane protein involved in colicin uptake